jgi:hypothetical protein
MTGATICPRWLRCRMSGLFACTTPRRECQQFVHQGSRRGIAMTLSGGGLRMTSARCLAFVERTGGPTATAGVRGLPQRLRPRFSGGWRLAGTRRDVAKMHGSDVNRHARVSPAGRTANSLRSIHAATRRGTNGRSSNRQTVPASCRILPWSDSAHSVIVGLAPAIHPLPFPFPTNRQGRGCASRSACRRRAGNCSAHRSGGGD